MTATTLNPTLGAMTMNDDQPTKSRASEEFEKVVQSLHLLTKIVDCCGCSAEDATFAASDDQLEKLRDEIGAIDTWVRLWFYEIEMRGKHLTSIAAETARRYAEKWGENSESSPTQTQLTQSCSSTLVEG